MTECYSENTLVELASAVPVSPSVAAHLAECAECRVAMSELMQTSGPASVMRELLLRRGDRIGRYEVVDLLGRGGVGIVYLARDLTLGRRVALKLMHAGRDQQHLLHEAKVTARLRHSNIRTVYDVGLEGDVLFVAMEYVEGMSLRAWLADRARGWNDVLAVMTQVAAALEAAHAQGHLHCDVKPENVLVSPEGSAWLTDFGFARSERASTPWAGGTVGYLAPELMDGGSPTQSSDQFAFGATLHEALAQASRVPRRLRRVAARARAGSPRNRFTSMVEVRRRLERVQRPWFGAAHWLGLVGVALFALTVAAWQWHEPSRVCARDAERTTALWSGEVRAEVQRVFQRDSNRAALTAWDSVDQRLQSYVTQLTRAQHAACVLEAPALERRSTQHCLAQRALEVSALVKQLTRFPEAAIERAQYGVQALGRLSECADEAVRTAGLLPVPERAPSSVVEQVRTLIANARAMRWLNQPAGGLPAAREAVALARELSHAPLEADALACLGELLLATGQFDEAAQTLTSAALRAEA
ncbi:MAG: serine/threonine protein kinase, partial [Archangium sp.]|nr:serine/threonine protein kinase [Archangium sp.]